MELGNLADLTIIMKVHPVIVVISQYVSQIWGINIDQESHVSLHLRPGKLFRPRMSNMIVFSDSTRDMGP